MFCIVKQMSVKLLTAFKKKHNMAVEKKSPVGEATIGIRIATDNSVETRYRAVSRRRRKQGAA